MVEIADLIAQPESKVLEFKRDLSSLGPVLKTIVAFANTAGGMLIIGLTADRQVIGINDVFKAEETLANAIADSISLKRDMRAPSEKFLTSSHSISPKECSAMS